MPLSMSPETDREEPSPQRPSGFFPLSPGDIAYVVSVLAIAVVAFLPWARDVSWAGVALLGWLMAGLMVAAPIIALVRIASERRADRRRDEP